MKDLSSFPPFGSITRMLTPTAARALLFLPRQTYHAVIRLRNLCFERGLLKVHRVAAPVISVGNIAWGGTGKTPMVEWVARRLLELGRRPAILSRGYGGRKAGRVDDENEALREKLPGVPVLVGADRAASAGRALAEGLADCFVMDDGFQHRRLHRDLDIVMVDPLADALRTLYREPMSSLARADVIVALPGRAEGDAVVCTARLQAAFAGALVCAARRAPLKATNVRTGEEIPLSELSGVRAGAFCGIGSPQGFRSLTTQLLGRQPEFFVAFRDHYPYSEQTIRSLVERARRSGVSWLLTTAKDAVKVKPLAGAIPPDLEVVCIEITLAIESGEAELRGAIEGAVGQGA